MLRLNVGLDCAGRSLPSQPRKTSTRVSCNVTIISSESHFPMFKVKNSTKMRERKRLGLYHISAANFGSHSRLENSTICDSCFILPFRRKMCLTFKPKGDPLLLSHPTTLRFHSWCTFRINLSQNSRIDSLSLNHIPATLHNGVITDHWL